MIDRKFAVVLLVATHTTAVAAHNITNVTSVPAPAPADNVNPVVVGIGVIVLLLLFSASFYFVVVWPKRELSKYRKKFERMVRRYKVDVDGVTSVRDSGFLYGGLQQNDDCVANGETADKGRIAVPTYRQITAELQRQEVLRPPTRPGGGPPPPPPPPPPLPSPLISLRGEPSVVDLELQKGLLAENL